MYVSASYTTVKHLKNVFLLFIFKYWLIIEISPKYVTPRNSQEVFSDNYVVFLMSLSLSAQDMEILHVHTWNKPLIITLNGPLYKTVEETLQHYIFHVYQPRIAFHDQTGVFGGVQLLAPGETDFWIQYFRRTLCALNKGGEQGEKCTPWRHWIWTLFWLRAVGTEADICEVVKISQIMRQGDKQVPDRNDSSPPAPASILCFNVTSQHQ